MENKIYRSLYADEEFISEDDARWYLNHALCTWRFPLRKRSFDRLVDYLLTIWLEKDGANRFILLSVDAKFRDILIWKIGFDLWNTELGRVVDMRRFVRDALENYALGGDDCVGLIDRYV